MIKLNQLIHLGLNEREGDLYLACHRAELSTVQGLSRTLHMNRSSLYILLENLKIKGLVHEVYYGKRKFYEAAPPMRLKEILFEKIHSVKTDLDRFDDEIMPKLNSINKVKKAHSSYYDLNRGLQKIRQLHTQEFNDSIYALLASTSDANNILKSLEKIRNTNKTYREIWMYDPDHSKNRKGKSIFIKPNINQKVIIPSSFPIASCAVFACHNSIQVIRYDYQPYVSIIEDKSLFIWIKQLVNVILNVE